MPQASAQVSAMTLPSASSDSWSRTMRHPEHEHRLLVHHRRQHVREGRARAHRPPPCRGAAPARQVSPGDHGASSNPPRAIRHPAPRVALVRCELRAQPGPLRRRAEPGPEFLASRSFRRPASPSMTTTVACPLARQPSMRPLVERARARAHHGRDATLNPRVSHRARPSGAARLRSNRTSSAIARSRASAPRPNPASVRNANALNRASARPVAGECECPHAHRTAVSGRQSARARWTVSYAAATLPAAEELLGAAYQHVTDRRHQCWRSAASHRRLRAPRTLNPSRRPH